LSKKKRPERARTRRRVQERDADRLARDRARLQALLPGGSPERPLEVSSVAVIESRGRSLECPRCDGPLELLEHVVTGSGAARLRELRLRCRGCGRRRSAFFRVVVPLAN
jgi:hypothetical protein